MLKKVNLQGIIILIVVLAVIQYGVGLFVSPVVSSFIVEKINDASGARISIEKVNIWPVTLSVSLKKLDIFNPDSTDERIVSIGSASARISPFGLLSKRVVFSRIALKNAEITLEGEPDGSFNIEKITGPKDETEKKGGIRAIIDRFRGKKDWFSRIWNTIKKRSSKEAKEEREQERKDAGKITREVVQLPRGRRVKFKTPRDKYLFEVQKLTIKNALIHMIGDKGDGVDVEKASVDIRGIVFDPEKGADIRKIAMKGSLVKDGVPAGKFSVFFEKSFKKNDIITEMDISGRNIDLKAVNFIYEDSIPVGVEKGLLDLRSGTTIVNEQLNSRNTLVLKDHVLTPKRGKLAAGFIPVPILCEALNGINPVDLKFDITGTVDKPEFSGLQETLKKVAGPALGNVKEQGMSAVKSFFNKGEEGSTQDASSSSDGQTQSTVDSIKSLFSRKTEE